MKITITHDQASIDPSATYSDEQFEQVKTALEAEYKTALRSAFPEADVEFVTGNDTYSIRISDDPDGSIADRVQQICETVYETGNFWM